MGRSHLGHQLGQATAKSGASILGKYTKIKGVTRNDTTDYVEVTTY